MEPKDMIDLCKTDSPIFADLWAGICNDAQKEQEDWIAELRKQGVKAAHPDDGWVDRDKNRVHFSYPTFYDGVDIGDIIALGTPSKYRLAKIIGRHESTLLLVWWLFEESKDE